MADQRPSVKDLRDLIQAQEQRDEVADVMQKITDNPEIWSSFLEVSFKNEGRMIIAPSSLFARALVKLIAPKLSELSIDVLNDFAEAERQARKKVGL